MNIFIVVSTDSFREKNCTGGARIRMYPSWQWCRSLYCNGCLQSWVFVPAPDCIL